MPHPIRGSLIRRTLISVTVLFVLAKVQPTQAQNEPGRLYPILLNYAKNLYPEYRKIPEIRRRTIESIADYIYGAIQIDRKSVILIIGTNNSTRSILAEAWCRAAAQYYNVKNIEIYSGGTEVTHVSPYAMKVLENAGFIIYKITDDENPRYEVKYSYNLDPVSLYSKKYNDKEMPAGSYGAIFVCPNADQNIPYLNAMNFRASLHYFDPGAYDHTPEQMKKYLQRSHEISVEMFYLFYCIKNKST